MFLESQEDLVSIHIAAMSHIINYPVLPIMNLLATSADPSS